MNIVRKGEKADTAGNQGMYSPTILKNILSLVLHNFLYFAASECNTASKWLNQMV